MNLRSVKPETFAGPNWENEHARNFGTKMRMTDQPNAMPAPENGGSAATPAPAATEAGSGGENGVTVQQFNFAPNGSGNGAESSSAVSPEMMFKISKKIAQLTKVIYSLNTRNDDLERDLEVRLWMHTIDLRCDEPSSNC